MQPRFPPRESPEYFQYLEEWLIKERVDNERQWRLIRELESAVTGLDPIITIVNLGFHAFGSGSGSGSGSVSSAPCGCSHTISTRTVHVSGLTGACAALNGIWSCTNSAANFCRWDGTSVYAVHDAGSGAWIVYSVATGCIITSGAFGTCTNATLTNAGTCCPSDPVTCVIS